MRILFMGTPEIAQICLRSLVEAGLDVCAVFTQPDRPKGRGRQLMASPVKEYAESVNIPVFSPLKIRKSLDIIKKIGPDLIAVMAYGKILPADILNYPAYGCVNVHASLLPKYRGAAPIQAAVAAGDSLGGITTMYMAEELDSGDIIFTREVEISPDDTGGTLHDKYAAISGDLLIRTIGAIEQGVAPRLPQDHGKATYAPSLKKEDGEIDWNKSPTQVRNHVRAYNPWPGTYTELNGTVYKIHACNLGSDIKSGEPGIILSTGERGIEFACGGGSVYVTEIQAPGKKRMSAADFLRGHKI